jgi:two-component system OmpR family sensor kinase
VSLRARLILGLLVLAAAGLITLAAITYADQRSFLLHQVDQEAQSGVRFIDRWFDCHNANVSGYPPPLIDCGGPFGGSAPEVTLPAGSWGYRYDGKGNQLYHAPVTYQQPNGSYKVFPAPTLPGSIPVDHAITVGSRAGVAFRLLAQRTGDEPGTTMIAIPLTDVDQTLHRLFVIEALVIAGILAALAVLSWWVVRLGLRPLDRIATTAGAIAAGDLSQRVTTANERTEVGRLGLALNAMLAQIERAFHEREASESRLRRFLADASHELRTPLAAIRGYAELFRLGAASEPEEAASAMQRIEEEAKRMGDLVENLLTLARLDQVPQPAREPVDLSRLVADAAQDARATAPDRAISFMSDGPVTVMGDPGQLRQVLSNLVRNTLVHTPAGTPVELSISREGEEAVVEVRDHGKGLPTEDPALLFERFWRADPGRGRGAAGAGLGLSIVRAIVEAHGGRVAAANAPGNGALFTVRLPARASGQTSTADLAAPGASAPSR